MLEAAQIEAWTSLSTVAMTSVTIYLTVVSGYLVVAYTAGRNLTKLQLIVISAIFVLFSLFFTAGANIHFTKATEYAEAIGVYTGVGVARTIFIAQIAGIIAALVFMYSSRKKPKK